MGNVHTAFALRDGTGATRNDGRTKTDALKSVGTADAELNDWRALALVAVASRKNGERAAAKPKKFGRWCARLRIGAYVLAAPFPLAQPISAVHCFVITASPINHENVPPGHSY